MDIQLTADRVYLAGGYTDMRKSIDGLSAVVSQQYDLNPFLPSLFLVCGRRRDRIKVDSLFMISFLGIFLYLMLFESRARYLFCFVPVLVVQAALGLENYSIILCEYRNRWRMKHHGRSKEDAPPGVH